MEKIHFVIENKNLNSKETFLNNILNNKHNIPSLKEKKGLLFSNSVLEKFITEEVKYNTKTLNLKEERSIRFFSSGEQKKALLTYLIQQEPDFLILDSPFESLDISTTSILKDNLIELSSKILLIQIFNRREEILPIITNVLEVNDDIIIETFPFKNYTFSETEFTFKGKIPKPITFYKNIPDQIISLQNVNVHYDDKCILNNINWTINKGEFWHLIGPNGSGKSTILSMIYGNNVKAFRQNIYLFGKKKGSGESIWEIKEKIGYFSPAILELFQRKTTVKQMVISGFFDSIGLYITPTTLQIKLAKEWIKLLNLEHKKDTYFKNLTTAEQRLVLIARAMIKHPPLLILDEPLINLSNQETAIIVSLINKIVKESDTTLLFVSHRQVDNLLPNFIYELVPTQNGSTGNVK